MLVDPVRRQRGPDAVPPPRLPGHLRAPDRGGVPVVAHVVVVEDHAGGHAGQEPPHLRVAPRVAVQPDVLVEADDLVVGPLGVAVPPPGDPAAVLRRELVRVDLVAEQQQRVRPLLARKPGRGGGEGVEGINTELRRHLRRRVRRHLGIAARAEDDPKPSRGRRTAGAQRAGRERRDRRRPHHLAVDLDVVRVGGVGLQTGDRHERVVMPPHLKRAGCALGLCRRPARPVNCPACDGDRRRPVELHPHRGGRLVDVAQDWPEHQRGHSRAPRGRAGARAPGFARGLDHEQTLERQVTPRPACGPRARARAAPHRSCRRRCRRWPAARAASRAPPVRRRTRGLRPAPEPATGRRCGSRPRR
ncbi:MAG: hypothetical protein K0R87_2538 [Pseudonocardia sp.]|nr:hypothetical protein [Pseudonocardia sp.]